VPLLLLRVKEILIPRLRIEFAEFLRNGSSIALVFNQFTGVGLSTLESPEIFLVRPKEGEFFPFHPSRRTPSLNGEGEKY